VITAAAVAGIDVGKAALDVAVDQMSGVVRYANNAAGMGGASALPTSIADLLSGGPRKRGSDVPTLISVSPHDPVFSTAPLAGVADTGAACE
jgi:hypothetical protein